MIPLSDSNSAVLLKQLNLAIGLPGKKQDGVRAGGRSPLVADELPDPRLPEYFTPFEMGRKERTLKKSASDEQNIWNPRLQPAMLARQLNLTPTT